MARPTFVIVGAGLGGLSAADALRAEGFDGRIVLVGDEAHLPYTKPPLSKGVLQGVTEADETLLRPPSWYEDRQIELRLGVAATAIDPGPQVLELADTRRLHYDRLLLATGGRARNIDVAGADLVGVHRLRTIDDALAIRERLLPGAPVVVLGAGFVGAEVAASARAVGCDVTVLEIAEFPLNRVLGAEVGRVFSEIHRDNGVTLRTGVGVDRIEGNDEVTHVVASDGIRHEASAVVVGVGMDPNIDLFAHPAFQVGNGVTVDEHCETSVPHVYAAGDIARHPNPILGRYVRVEQWQNAQHQSAAAARNMLGPSKPFAEVPWFWSDQYGLNLQMAGLPSGSDEVVFRGDVEARDFSVFYLRGGVIAGVVGVNRALDVRVGRRLIQQHAAVSSEALADESVELGSLATRS